MFYFRCPHCGNRLAVAEELAGKQATCGGCRQPITIIRPSQVPKRELSPIIRGDNPLTRYWQMVLVAVTVGLLAWGVGVAARTLPVRVPSPISDAVRLYEDLLCGLALLGIGCIGGVLLRVVLPALCSLFGGVAVTVACRRRGLLLGAVLSALVAAAVGYGYRVYHVRNAAPGLYSPALALIFAVATGVAYALPPLIWRLRTWSDAAADGYLAERRLEYITALEAGDLKQAVAMLRAMVDLFGHTIPRSFRQEETLAEWRQELNKAEARLGKGCCPACEGKGEFRSHTCHKCGGEGFTAQAGDTVPVGGKGL